jgi:uncharacterized membrane protein YqhA
MLKKLLERGELVVIVPIITLFISAILLGVYGAFLAVETVVKFFTDPAYREVTFLPPDLFFVIDLFLLSILLGIFALSLYELFVGKLNVPWLKMRSFDELKASLVSVLILFVAIAYIKLLVSSQNPVDTLLFGVATGILMVVLIQWGVTKSG